MTKTQILDAIDAEINNTRNIIRDMISQSNESKATTERKYLAALIMSYQIALTEQTVDRVLNKIHLLNHPRLSTFIDGINNA